MPISARSLSASGYIVRYAILAETADILVTRIWHGRESRL
jgi:toxin ParE1/3/4